MRRKYMARVAKVRAVMVGAGTGGGGGGGDPALGAGGKLLFYSSVVFASTNTEFTGCACPRIETFRFRHLDQFIPLLRPIA